MLMHVRILKRLMLSFTFLIAGIVTSLAANSVKLYTPYTKISVPPGESIDYTIEIKNNESEVKNLDVYVAGMPKSWNYTLKAGGFNIQQISILPGEKKTLNLKVDVPLKVNKGNHTFKVVAKNMDELALVVNVSEIGTYETEFTSQQANMQGHSKSNFTFRTKIKNQTGEKQLYSLRANTPEGWQVLFKPNSQQATAVEVDPNQTSNISIEVKPPYNVMAGTYEIPVQALTSNTSADLNLEVVITGSYEMELTTPKGLLSASITAGTAKKFELVVRNTGTSELKDIKFAKNCPKDWEVTFSPDKLKSVAVGASENVTATIKAFDKAIPGDYAINLTSSTKETTSKATLRISVKTPLLWGWLGVMIILAVIAGLFFLFRKYGRR